MNETRSKLDGLEELYIANYDLVYRAACYWLYRLTGSAADAEDTVQSVFVVAGRRWDQLEAHPKPEGWLVKTTENICREQAKAYRKRGSGVQHSIQELLERQPGAYGTLYTGAAEDETAAQDVLISLEQTLNEGDYAILRSYCLEGHSMAEIAAEEGISEAALRVRIHRLRKTIAKILILLVTLLTRQTI